MAATNSLLTRPARTAMTTLSVSASVTLSPLTNWGAIPCLFNHSETSLPPPWTTTTATPRRCKATRSSSVVSWLPSVLPPSFTTMALFLFISAFRLSGICAVNSNIPWGEVTAPGRCLAPAQIQIEPYTHFFSAQGLPGRNNIKGLRDSRLHHADVAQVHIDFLLDHLRPAASHCGDHPAPVGVGAVDRSLDQRGAGNCARTYPGILDRASALHFHFYQPFGALTVPGDAARQFDAYPVERLLECPARHCACGYGPVSGHSIGQQQYRVARTGIAIDRDHIERHVHRPFQGNLKER